MAKEKKGKLGRLSSLGVHQPWHLPLLLPAEYRDFRNPVTHVSQENLDKKTLFHLRKKTNLTPVKWVKGGKVPLRNFVVIDQNGLEIVCSLFGDTRDLEPVIENSDSLFLWGELSWDGRSIFLNSIEIIPPSLIGRIDPVYPGVPKIIKPETVKKRVEEDLERLLPETVTHLRNLLMIRNMEEQNEFFRKIGLPPLSFKKLILTAHRPDTPDEGWMAQKVLRRIATYFALQVSQSAIQRPIDPSTAIPVTQRELNKVLTYLPYSLTDEQLTAVTGTIQRLAEPRKALIAYSADVGAGKTTLFGSVAAACSLVGAKTAILAPNTVLCEQLYKELSETWPFIKYSKVWGKNAELDPEASIFIGTTALINRAKENGVSFNLVVVDEEHRFSREQKDALTNNSTNYIASTATPIPRTMQLANMGAFDVFRITKTHVKKEIMTHILTEQEKHKVDHFVAKTLEKGFQVFIVLPIAEGGEKPKITAEEAFEMWNSKYPGRVGLVHGKMKDEEKANALQKMRNGEIDILCATTVIEVGITIKQARTMVVYHPEVLGLATLHQLRGRLARGGGIGHFVLYLPQFVSNKTFERLLLLKKESSGYRLAEEDLKLRGFGDLAPNAEKQTGGMPSLLPGYEVTVEDVEELDKIMQQAKQRITGGENEFGERGNDCSTRVASR